MNKRIMRNLALSLAAALILVLLPVMPTAEAAVTTSWENEVVGETFDPQPTTLTQYTISRYNGGPYSTEQVTIDTGDPLGSENNPIRISSEEELILFGQQTSNATLGKYYILDKVDGVYDMRGDEGYYMLPLFPSALRSGSDMPWPDNYFQGTLIGNDAVIKNANIGDYSEARNGYMPGLFSAMDAASVCDLILSDITLYLDSTVNTIFNNGAGALASYAKDSSVLNCHVTGVNYENIGNVSSYTGGLLGYIYNSKVIRCSVEADSVPQAKNYGDPSIGGLVGRSQNSSLIENCTVDWALEVDSAEYVGGIVGYNYYGTVNRSSHIGTVSLEGTSNNYVGGVAGENYGTVKNSFQHGDVTLSASGSNACAGGVVGFSNSVVENCYQNGAVSVTDTAVNAYAGGIAGISYNANINNSYHVGAVSAVGGTSDVAAGGLVGESYNDSVSYSYYRELDPDPSTFYTVIGCGTFVSATNSVVTLFNDWANGTEDSSADSTYVTSGTTTLLAALNGWVTANPADPGYASWSVDATVNGGYPILADAGTEMQKTVTVTGAGTGGTATGTYRPGTTVNLDAGTKPGYSFVEWTSGDVTISNADSANVSFTMPGIDITVTANWEETVTTPPSVGGTTQYTVKFDSRGGSAVADKSVASGSTVTKPTDPTREGYTFTGWYTDEACTAPYDFSAKVTKAFTLYAGWAWVNPFEDVKEGDWFYGDVEYVNENGLMEGTSASPMRFSPQTSITRGMIVTVLWRENGELRVENGELGVGDVLEGAYYYDAVMWAADNGIVEGYGDGKFGPDDSITRQDLAVILLRYMDYAKVEYVVTDEYRIFADEDAISDYAKNAVQVLNKLGIINGRGNNVIDPQGTATRAEAAAMLHRLLGAAL